MNCMLGYSLLILSVVRTTFGQGTGTGLLRFHVFHVYACILGLFVCKYMYACMYASKYSRAYLYYILLSLFLFSGTYLLFFSARVCMIPKVCKNWGAWFWNG